MNKNVFYFGIGTSILGVLYCAFTKDLTHFWITGSGLTVVTLALLIDKLTLDWRTKFAEIEGKFLGTTDAVRGCYADIEAVKAEVRALKPDSIEELEMRVENLEAESGLKRAMGMQDAVYRPRAPRKAEPTA